MIGNESKLCECVGFGDHFHSYMVILYIGYVLRVCVSYKGKPMRK